MKVVPVSLFERFHGLFDSIPAPLVERFPMYAKAVQDHVAERGVVLPDTHMLRTALFIDCNQIKTNRPGGGPAAAGAEAPRKDSLIQRAFYNGWGRNHGLKAEAAGAPDGLIVWLYGLVSLRRADPWVLQAGGFNAKLAAAQVHKPPSEQFISYGDGAYPHMSHVTSARGPVAVDKAMSSVRELIEHLFGESDSYFPYMADKKNHHLMSSQALKELYFSVQLLRNCYTCLYHDKTSTRMKCPPPSLEEYLSWV